MSQTKAELIEPQGNVAFDTNTLYVDAGNNRVGIGTTSATESLHVAGNARFGAADANTAYLEIGQGATGNRAAFIDLTGDTTYTDYGLRVTRENGGANGDSAIAHRGTGSLRLESIDSGSVSFKIGGSEAGRFDSSRRFLVGTSSARSLGAWASALEVEGTSFSGSSISITNNENTTNGAFLNFGKSRGTSIGSNTIVNSGDNIAHFVFYAANGSGTNAAAAIDVQVDGTPGVGDMPGRIVFSTTADGASSPTERMRVDSMGRSSIVAANDVLYLSSVVASGTAHRLLEARHSGTAGTPYSGTTSFQVFTNGNVQNTNNSYAGISDVKLKENIVDASSQWNDIKDLQVRKYNFKEETGQQTHTQIGLIAQEVELVSPGLVTESPDRDAEGNDLGTTTKSVNYSVLYMKAVKALQEAMERIETLEAKVAALESA